MNISPVANNLIKAIEDYKEESSKVSYRFTTEEELRLLKEIEILRNHINILINYENNKNKNN